MNWEPTLGAIHLENQHCRFRVWAPNARRVDVNLCGSRLAPLQPGEHGWFEASVEGVEPGTRYLYRLDGGEGRPDPASRFQPEGVHGRSMVVDRRYGWRDEGWRGIALEEYIFYELHVGTFTPEGTFEAVIPHLGRLVDLGVTAVELMPVIVVTRGEGAVLAFNFGREERAVDLPGEKVLDSADERWGGPGSGERLAPRSVALYLP